MRSNRLSFLEGLGGWGVNSNPKGLETSKSAGNTIPKSPLLHFKIYMNMNDAPQMAMEASPLGAIP